MDWRKGFYVALVSWFFLILGPVQSFAYDGEPDSSFGTNGVVSINTGTVEAFQDVVEDNKKIVAGGESDGVGFIARFDEAGVKDSGFGVDGVVSIGDIKVVQTLRILNDGKLLAGGIHDSHAVVVSLNADGSSNNTFGANADGKALIDFGEEHPVSKVRELVLLEDNKILVMGIGGNKVLLAQLNADGTLDTGFDTDGIKVIELADSSAIVWRVKRDADGNYVVAGRIGDKTCDENTQTYTNFFVARFLPDGTVDSNFGEKGYVRGTYETSGNSCTYVNDVLIASETGKILVAGKLFNSSSAQGFLIRLKADGLFDETFGTAGWFTTFYFSWINRIAVQADGKLIVMGYYVSAYGGGYIALGRISADGLADTFGVYDDGTEWMVSPEGYMDSMGLAVAVKSDGKILTAGYSQIDNSSSDSSLFQNIGSSTSLGTLSITSDPDPLPEGFEGLSYKGATLIASGGEEPYTFTVKSGDLPTGIDLSEDGQLSGTPTGGGLYKFTVKVTDNQDNTGEKELSIKIFANDLPLFPESLSVGYTNKSYSEEFSTGLGVENPSFSVLEGYGDLPTGFNLSESGKLSGKTSKVGKYTFVVKVEGEEYDYDWDDYFTVRGFKKYTLEIIKAVVIKITPTSLPTGEVGKEYKSGKTVLKALGGTAPYTFTVVDENGKPDKTKLPPGITMSTKGVFSGKPKTTGWGKKDKSKTYAFKVKVTDKDKNTKIQDYKIKINKKINKK